MQRQLITADDDIAQPYTGYKGSNRIISILPTVITVALLGWLIAQFVTNFSGYYIVVGVAALVLGFALVRNLQIGVLAYFFIAALAFGESPEVQSPNSGYSAGLMPSQVLLAFLAILWLGKMVFSDGFKLVKSELNLPLGILAVVALFSLVTNNVLRGTRELLFHQMILTQVAEVGLLYFSIAAFFLAANTIKDRKWIKRIFVPVVLVGSYYTVFELRDMDFPIPLVWGGLILASAIAFVYARLLFDKLDRLRAMGLSLLLAVMLFTAYRNMAWVSGSIAVTVAILVVSYYRSRALAVILLILALAALFVYPGIYFSIHEESHVGGDFDRFVIWQDAFHMFTSVNPILGIGPGNYHPYVYYYNTIWFGSRTYTTAHSNYMQMTAELGLVGLAVFLWVIVAAVRVGNRAARTVSSDMKWLGVAATSIFVAIAVSSIFGDYLFPSRGNNGIVNFGTTVYTWLILGAAVAAGTPRVGDWETGRRGEPESDSSQPSE